MQFSTNIKKVKLH